jgi:hypothetical protein
MICSACGANAEFEDGFCTACGVEQPASRLPVKSERPGLPAIWRDAVPIVARGAALVAAGIAAEFLLRSMARGAVPPTAPRKQKVQPVARQETAFFEEIVAVTHTVVTRRVVVKR